MIVTIWRHGEAGSAASDRARELTPRGRGHIELGRSRFQQACERRGLALPELLLHSEWTRTTQTADILHQTLPATPRRSEAALIPGSDSQAVDNMLQPLIDAADAPQHLLLVSHQPLVSRLVEHYLADHGRVPGLPPGGMACLELDVAARGCAQLLFWALPPNYEACQ